MRRTGISIRMVFGVGALALIAFSAPAAAGKEIQTHKSSLAQQLEDSEGASCRLDGRRVEAQKSKIPSIDPVAKRKQAIAKAAESCLPKQKSRRSGCRGALTQADPICMPSGGSCILNRGG